MKSSLNLQSSTGYRREKKREGERKRETHEQEEIIGDSSFLRSIQRFAQNTIFFRSPLGCNINLFTYHHLFFSCYNLQGKKRSLRRRISGLHYHQADRSTHGPYILYLTQSYFSSLRFKRVRIFYPN